ncbi:hypothetical protein N1851_013953 [Merluccius polli]|uniref:Uncharacterized protein n=1 Tax=Merluccius polli TaxID=89951 RepID=A0AA47P1B1_MERPO|nr:hypothetical protein N1851_013953 [Merluccius polli]
MASLVDPRFRAKYIPSEKVDALKHKVVLEAESLLADQGSCQPDPAVPTVSEPADQEAAVPPTAKKKSLAQREAIENKLSSYL